jgi:hypothetical protein
VDALAAAHLATRVQALVAGLAEAGLPSLVDLDRVYGPDCVRMPRNLGMYLARRVSTVRAQGWSPTSSTCLIRSVASYRKPQQ